MTPKSSVEALATNKKHYVTGRPCKNGHYAPRNMFRQCLTCSNNRSKVYKKSHPEKIRTSNSLRKKRTQIATPKWLKQRHKKEIRAMYEAAMLMTEVMQEPYVVDHIVPLNGKTVCGLHVPWNLQVITAHKNSKKSNKLIDNP